MDGFTRGIRGWHLGRDLDHTLTLVALQRALVKYPAPEIHHSDQGVQYAATAYTQVLQAAQVQISMAEQGEAWQNGYAERLIRTIKEEEVDLSEYLDYGERTARRRLHLVIDNRQRIVYFWSTRFDCICLLHPDMVMESHVSLPRVESSGDTSSDVPKNMAVFGMVRVRLTL